MSVAHPRQRTRRYFNVADANSCSTRAISELPLPAPLQRTGKHCRVVPAQGNRTTAMSQSPLPQLRRCRHRQSTSNKPAEPAGPLCLQGPRPQAPRYLTVAPTKTCRAHGSTAISPLVAATTCSTYTRGFHRSKSTQWQTLQDEGKMTIVVADALSTYTQIFCSITSKRNPQLRRNIAIVAGAISSTCAQISQQHG